MTDKLLSLAESLDRFRIYWFGKGWGFGPISGGLAMLSFLIRAIRNAAINSSSEVSNGK